MRLLVALALILATCVPALAQPCFIDARMTGDPQVLCPSGDGTSTLTIDLIAGTLPWFVVLSDGQVQSGSTPSFNFSVTGPGTYQATAVDADGCTDFDAVTLVVDDSGCTPFQVLGNFGTASRGAGFASTITITNNGTGTAPAGSSIIVAFASGGATGGGPIAGCSDSQGNTYTVDVNLPSTSNSRALAICSAINITHALSATDTITVQFPTNGNGQHATANVFTGLALSGALDRVHTAAGNSKAPNSGNTDTTSHSDELLIGAFSFNGTNFNTFSAGEGYTLTNPSQGAGANTGLGSEYRVVSSAGQYAATGSLTTGTGWRAAIATYKLQTGSPPP